MSNVFDICSRLTKRKENGKYSDTYHLRPNEYSDWIKAFKTCGFEYKDHGEKEVEVYVPRSSPMMARRRVVTVTYQ